MPLSSLDLRQCTMRRTTHLNGGGVFFGWVWACIEHPRLQRMDKCYRRAARPVEITYMVDGAPVASLDEAAERLNSPPTLSDELAAALCWIGPDFADHRKTVGYELLRALTDRGFLEWGERGMCRRVGGGT